MKRILLFTALMGFACMPLMAAGPMSILGKVQRKGQEQAVANNLKQLATMLIMYAGDHNNRLPAAAGAAGLAELRPYGASDKLLIVPYDYVSKAANGDKLTEANTSYAYLGNAVGELSKIRKPSVIPLIIRKDLSQGRRRCADRVLRRPCGAEEIRPHHGGRSRQNPDEGIRQRERPCLAEAD